MNLYSLEAIENIMNKYCERGGEITTIKEGCLGYGLMVLHGEGLKTTIIKEVYLNEWSSGHTVRMYNKIPKKYEKLLENVYN